MLRQFVQYNKKANKGFRLRFVNYHKFIMTIGKIFSFLSNPKRWHLYKMYIRLGFNQMQSS